MKTNSIKHFSVLAISAAALTLVSCGGGGGGSSSSDSSSDSYFSDSDSSVSTAPNIGAGDKIRITNRSSLTPNFQISETINLVSDTDCKNSTSVYNGKYTYTKTGGNTATFSYTTVGMGAGSGGSVSNTIWTTQKRTYTLVFTSSNTATITQVSYESRSGGVLVDSDTVSDGVSTFEVL